MYFDAHTDILFDAAARLDRGETCALTRFHLPRLRRGGAEGAMLALWLEQSTPDPWARTLHILSVAQRELCAGGKMRLVRSVREAEAARQEGVFYAFFSAEGLDAAGEDLGRLEVYYQAGVRSAMLTWNGRNALAGGAFAPEHGLTELGRRAVRKLQAFPMVVDVSHLSERSFWDVLRETCAPLVASHSNCRALCDVPRNLTDDQLRALRDTGGVVGLNAWHAFVDAEPAHQTVERLAQHAMHMIDCIGVEHVGCGFDFCEFLPGDGDAPRLRGLEDSAAAQGFFAQLRKRGLSQAEVGQIARGNFLRVLQTVLG